MFRVGNSSVTMVLAWAALRGRSLPRYRLYMGLTLLGGLPRGDFPSIDAVESRLEAFSPPRR